MLHTKKELCLQGHNNWKPGAHVWQVCQRSLCNYCHLPGTDHKLMSVVWHGTCETYWCGHHLILLLQHTTHISYDISLCVEPILLNRYVYESIYPTMQIDIPLHTAFAVVRCSSKLFLLWRHCCYVGCMLRTHIWGAWGFNHLFALPARLASQKAWICSWKSAIVPFIKLKTHNQLYFIWGCPTIPSLSLAETSSNNVCTVMTTNALLNEMIHASHLVLPVPKGILGPICLQQYKHATTTLKTLKFHRILHYFKTPQIVCAYHGIPWW